MNTTHEVENNIFKEKCLTLESSEQMGHRAVYHHSINMGCVKGCGVWTQANLCAGPSSVTALACDLCQVPYL